MTLNGTVSSMNQTFFYQPDVLPTRLDVYIQWICMTTILFLYLISYGVTGALKNSCGTGSKKTFIHLGSTGEKTKPLETFRNLLIFIVAALDIVAEWRVYASVKKIIDSNNGLLPVQSQLIMWIKDGSLTHASWDSCVLFWLMSKLLNWHWSSRVIITAVEKKSRRICFIEFDR